MIMLVFFLHLFEISNEYRINVADKKFKQTNLNQQPIVGVLAQKLSESQTNIAGTSYISAGYIKYVEMSGARVVPILTNITEEELRSLFGKINGVIFPGCNVDLIHSSYRKNAEIIFNLAKLEFEKGGYFPILGTCLGFQAFSVLVANTDNVIESCKGLDDISINLNFNGDLGRMFKEAPEKILDILKNEPVTYNSHYNCVTTNMYKKTSSLQNFFRVLSTNKAKDGTEFISTYEARFYPFYATQWHPEENVFEFPITESGESTINHSYEAVTISQYMSNFFVNECRKSNHQFTDKEEERKSLIYNYPILYTEPQGGFEQIYVF
ncbi:gamma-glutamyl hydrolase A isoform X3 [Hydra vulgaris]|uniref:folate gamma-glutamyl hydrolase n=1 Tax=Hydra vulgaris TaxID=6087 RepID=A0ABM4CCS1_HYDVU